jgi:hypothetical protein
LVPLIGFPQTVIYDSIPRIYQFYPRDINDNDSAIVTIKGTVDNTILYDSVIVEIDTNAILWRHKAEVLSYSNNNANFLFKPKIYADTIEFRFRILFREDLSTPDQNAVIDSVVCGDAFLMGGGAQAMAHVPQPFFIPYQVEWIRTIGTMSTRSGSVNSGDPPSSDTKWGIATNINASDPDGTFFLNIGIIGMRLGELIIKNYGIPVCIINGACDGSPINNQLRPNDINWKSTPLNSVYGRLWYRVKKGGLLNGITAYIWWHGETDAKFYGNTNDYPNDFRSLRANWRMDYPSIQKFCTTQMHVGGGAHTGNGAPYAGILRQYQTDLALEATDTEIMSANDIGGFEDATHTYFDILGYTTMANRYFGQIRRDFYGYSQTEDLDSPNISQAWFTNAQKNVMVLEFAGTTNLFWQEDTIINGTLRLMRDYFYLHTTTEVDSYVVNTGQVYNGNLLRLELNNDYVDADSVTYLPVSYYNGESEDNSLYEGPWLTNSKDIPALSTYRLLINTVPGDDPLPVTLTSLTAQYLNGVNTLKWHTESEINNQGFIILRKLENEQNYGAIASYENELSLIGQGTTTQPTEYEFSDTNIIAEQTYYYLIQDVDYNGVKTNHGPVIVSSIGSNVYIAFNLYQNYPNPFNPSTTISFYLPTTQSVTLRVFDVLGRTVETLVNKEIEAGYHELLFESKSLASGNYYYQIQTEGYNSVKKMLLIK